MRNNLLIVLLTIIASNSVFAQNGGKYGDWTVTKVQGASNASTKNDSGSSIGWLCIGNNETCGPYISVAVDCTENATYPIMINSSVGAFHSTTSCILLAGGKYHLVNEIDIFSQAVESGGEIGIAFPLQDGKFKVSRFSTVGAIAAIKDARSLPKMEKNAVLRKDQNL